MDTNNIKLLKENLDAMDSAISWLKRSIGICNRIGIKPTIRMKSMTPLKYCQVGTPEQLI